MRWLVENWHVLLARPWDTIALVLLAVTSGAWVGTAFAAFRLYGPTQAFFD